MYVAFFLRWAVFGGASNVIEQTIVLIGATLCFTLAYGCLNNRARSLDVRIFTPVCIEGGVIDVVQYFP